MSEIGKWLAITACIVMSGLLVLNGHAKDAGGFVIAAVVIGLFA